MVLNGKNVKRFFFISLLTVFYSLHAQKTIPETLPELPGTLPGLIKAGSYAASGQLIVPAGDTVIIEKGVTIYFKPFSGITVKGMLITSGTPSHKVIFTSINDINKEVSSQPADWNGIKINDDAVGIRLYSTVINFSTFGVEITNSTTTTVLKDVSFYQNGLSNLTVGNTTILPPDMAAGSKSITYIRNQEQNQTSYISKLKRQYTNLAGTASGVLKPGEYLVDGTLLIPANTVYTLQSPTIIRFTPGSSILVKGTLKTDGGCGGKADNFHPIAGVIFTSYRDISNRSNSNVVPAPSDWGGIRISEQSDGVYLRSVLIDYSTYGINTEGYTTIYTENINFGLHNGILKSNGFRSTINTKTFSD